MDGAVRYEIGSSVSCEDADCGELSQVIIDPVAGTLTHLVVVPPPDGKPRLVPVALARPTAAGIQLSCTEAAFQALEEAVETHFVDAESQDLGYAREQVASWPFFSLAPSSPRLAMVAPEPVLMPAIEFLERVPAGEIKIRRGEHVHASDGAIGHVHGLVVDPADGTVTHLLLDEGHLRGKKQVAIPIGVISVGEGGVTVRLTKGQVKDLPPVDVGG